MAVATRGVGSLEGAGVRVHAEVISREEERALLAFLDASPWDSTLRRRTQHFGRAFDFHSKRVGEERPPIPACIAELIERFLSPPRPLLPWPSSADAQATANEYPPGVGIGAHIDTHSAFSDGIGSLSLGAGVAFRMQSSDRVADHSIWLPPRSLLVLSGEARYAWRHSISSRRYDCVEAEPSLEPSEPHVWVARSRRVSITLRCVQRSGKCSCAWPQMCDTQGGVSISLPTRLQKIHSFSENDTSIASEIDGSNDMEPVRC